MRILTALGSALVGTILLASSLVAASGWECTHPGVYWCVHGETVWSWTPGLLAALTSGIVLIALVPLAFWVLPPMVTFIEEEARKTAYLEQMARARKQWSSRFLGDSIPGTGTGQD